MWLLFPTSVTALLCHGQWSPGPGHHRLLLSDPASNTFYCLDYREGAGGVAAGQLGRAACRPAPALNISSTGPCILPLTATEHSAAPPPTPPSALLTLLLLCLATTHS